ncbi:MAG: hypothetical protein KJI69_04750 [Patescibacteria group bacterium]|nr:hypothetical protein [Patescibacteria group bacterium]
MKEQIKIMSGYIVFAVIAMLLLGSPASYYIVLFGGLGIIFLAGVILYSIARGLMLFNMSLMKHQLEQYDKINNKSR